MRGARDARVSAGADRRSAARDARTRRRSAEDRRHSTGVNPMKVAVLDDYQRVARDFADWDSLGPQVEVKFFHDHLDDEGDLVARLAPFEIVAIMRERTPFRRSLIERLPNLKLLVTTGKRNASVDVKACQDRGVTVCGTGISDGSTVELTWALILAVVRGIPREERGMREGRWQVGLGTEIRGKTLGVVGLGRLGSQVA